MENNQSNYIKELFEKQEYNLILDLFEKNKFPDSSDIVNVYLDTLNILDKRFYLLDLIEYLRLNYEKFIDIYSLEEINYLLLKSCLECGDIGKFKYYRENFENINYAPREFKLLYENFSSDKYIENIENSLIEKTSIDLFIVLSRFYILKNKYKLAFDNYINSLQKAFVLNNNYYIDIIYLDLLKYYKFFSIDNELYFEILSEIANSENQVFNYFIGLNDFYNFDFESSYKNLIKLVELDTSNDLNLDYYKYKSQYIIKIIKYLKSEDERVFSEIVRLIFATFSYFEIKLILEIFFEKKNILFFKILKKFLTHNFNLEDLELLNNDNSIFYKPKIVVSRKIIIDIEEKLENYLKNKNELNIYFEGLGLYGEMFYIISYLLFKDIKLNIYFNTKQNNFLNSKSDEFFKYIKMFNFIHKVEFYKDIEFTKIDFSFINLDFIDNFYENKLRNIDKILLYSSGKGLYTYNLKESFQ